MAWHSCGPGRPSLVPSHGLTAEKAKRSPSSVLRFENHAHSLDKTCFTLCLAMAQPALEAAHHSVCFPAEQVAEAATAVQAPPGLALLRTREEAAAATMAFRSGSRLGARPGRLGLPFQAAEPLSRPEEQADGGWAHARYPGLSAGGAVRRGNNKVGVPRVPFLRPSGWQGLTGSSGSAQGRKPEAAETDSPGQPHQGGGRGESGSGPRGAMGKRRTGLPDRWTDYLPLGKRMPGTRFIAFKVPLRKSFEWRLAPDERFSPSDLITQVKEQKEELGLIIDLTYTTRYYEPMELPEMLQYCKILTVGHEVPNNAIVSKFKSAVKKFLKENQHNDKLIGVHCTHGLNRTGYLVCRYLIDVEGMDPNMAIELFNRCRGHSIERKNYISALQKTSGTRRHSQIWNQNLIACYSEGNQAYNPQHAANSVHQRSGHNVRPSNKPFFSQQQFQGYQRPSFQELNPRGSPQQHRSQIDKHYWIP